MITYRLADSLPVEVLERLREQCQNAEAAFRTACEERLNAGLGACWLAQDEFAEVVERSLLCMHGKHYHLCGWVVMPNHVHVMIDILQGFRLRDIVQAWKGSTAHEINRRLNRRGAFWQADYWDRYVRNPDHFAAAVAYIEMNPVAARLAQTPVEWRWSSASSRSP